MNCNKCGAENDGASNYCQKCGERLVRELFCAKCGKPLKPDSKFCVECGTQIDLPVLTSVMYPHAEAEEKYQSVNAAGGLIQVPGKSFGLLHRMSAEKWGFAILMCGVEYILMIARFLKFNRNSDIADIDFVGFFFKDVFFVFIPYSIITAFFFDYKKETHAGWSGAFITAQIIIPVLFVWFHETSTKLTGRTPLDIINFDIFFVGVIEVAVLLLVQLTMYLRRR